MNHVLSAIPYDTVRQQTIKTLQETKKEQMEIAKQKKARPTNYDNNNITRKNPNSTSGIYLTAAKLA